MGVCLYNFVIGCFLIIDFVFGGLVNVYVYFIDLLSGFDFDGCKWYWKVVLKFIVGVVVCVISWWFCVGIVVAGFVYWLYKRVK